MKKYFELKEAKSKIVLAPFSEQVIGAIEDLLKTFQKNLKDSLIDREFYDTHELNSDRQRYKAKFDHSEMNNAQLNFLRSCQYLISKDFVSSSFGKKITNAINSGYSLGAKKQGDSISLGGPKYPTRIKFFIDILTMLLEENKKV